MVNTAIDTFKRVEDKYALSQKEVELFLAKVQEHIEPDTYYKYTVRSIYYDTVDSQLVIHSLNSPKYKMKLRLRCYVDVEDDTLVFLETKKKINNIVYKRRINLTAKEADDYMLKDIPHHVHNNVAAEIEYDKQYYHLEPKVSIFYDRECYKSKTEEDVRITFDRKIRYRIHDVSLKETGNEEFLGGEKIMMEIKAMDRYPMWLVNVLSEMKLYKQSFSKYGNIYRDHFDEMATNIATQTYEQVQKEELKCSVQY